MKSGEKIPLKVALTWIFGSCLLINGGAFASIKLWDRTTDSRRQDEKYNISAIVQTGPEREALKSLYLAELMGLSKDQPVNLYASHPREWERALTASPLIKRAHVKRDPPSTLFVDYSVRRPLAWVGGFENLAIDEEGYLFPITPFLTPKQLPELYLGIENPNFDQPVQSVVFRLALELLELVEALPGGDHLVLERIDLANAFAGSSGRREIVMILESGGERHYLRLSTKSYAQELGNYIVLCKRFTADDGVKERVIDLRIPKLAYIDEVTEND